MPFGCARARVLFEGEAAVDFEYLAANPAYGRLTGLGDVVGRRGSELMPRVGHGYRRLLDLCGKAARGGAVRRFEIRLPPLERWLSVCLFGPAAGEFAVILDDITERKLGELALQERSRRCDRLLQHIADGVYAYRLRANGARVFDYISPRACELLGIDAADVLREPDLAFATVHPEDLESLLRSNAAARDEPGAYRWEGRAVVRGAIRWMRVAADAQRLANGDTVWHGVVTDVTESRRTEQALVLAQQQLAWAGATRSRFVAAASHDLRQPLQAARLFLDALAPDGRGAQRREWIAGLGAALRSLGALVDDLVEITRLDAGLREAQRREVDFETGIAPELERLFAPLALQRGLRFMLHLPRRRLVLLTDPQLLAALLRQLVRHAFACTERGGILIAGRRRGMRALVQVWCSGARSSLAGVDPGDGLECDGTQATRLGVVERLAGLAGGRLALRSRRGGSVFELWLPLAEPAATGSAGPSRIE